ncbi:MAG: hypothetical protein JWM60_979 [Solirubrobacterales bacterium]|jgi:hypothetical protein|nr:hypothetical protein [Solirubrobacterales bacterium]
MSEFFASVRADLTDRRLLPIVTLVGLCLVAALAYAVLGSSGGSAEPRASSAPVRNPSPGIAVTGATAENAVAETTNGFKEQSSGKARDPFAALAGTATTTKAVAASSGASATSGSSSGSTGSEGSSGSGGASPESGGSSETGKSGSGETKKKAKAPKTVYDVAIEFGTLPPGITPETAQLTPFTKLKLQTPLPSAQLPMLIFRGVTAKGKTATFTVVGEAILSGTGSCLPSPTQCEAVDVKPGATEQLSYLAPDGQITVFELRVLSISAKKAKAKSAKASGWAESRAGRQLLRESGLVALPFLRYSSQPGVLVFAPHKASAARARIAVLPAAG